MTQTLVPNLNASSLGTNATNAAALLAGVLDSAMDAIITVDLAQNIVLYNRAAEKIFGWPGAQMLGQPLARLLPERFHAGHVRHVQHFGDTGVTTRRMGGGMVILGLRASGEEFPMDASISQLDSPEGRLYTVILRDVTERVRLQEERSAFAAAAHAIREEEKRHVARELHDELAQLLTALKMDTMWVRDNATSVPEASTAKLNEMLGMLDRAVASTRRIASDLRPLLLDDLGLVPAIEWLVSNFSQRYGVPCRLVVDESLELQEPYATAVFRIVQESLINVAKHAGASQASVAIEQLPGEIRLVVQDNGRGFAAQAPRKPQSLGLMGMLERAQLLKGQLVVQSSLEGGTRIEVHMPLQVAGAAP